jgi:thioredoxin-like negative regulator of GroEL
MMPESEMMAQARRAVREQRFEDAQGILVNVVVREPENDEAWILLAEMMTEPRRKMECLERARRINPRNPAVQHAIQELQAQLAQAAFGQSLVAGGEPNSSTAPHPELAAPLLEHAETLARELLMSTDPQAARRLGLELVSRIEQAMRHDEISARRWAHSAGRDALVKYERALTLLITNLLQTDPQLPLLRKQRQKALALFK